MSALMTLGVPEIVPDDTADGSVETADAGSWLGVGTARPAGPGEKVTASDDQLRGAQSQALMTPGEVARLFRVDPKTVSRWAMSGRVGSVRTIGGHRRFRKSEVETLLAGLTQDVAERV
jgi:excisionase family DNA binding protein